MGATQLHATVMQSWPLTKPNYTTFAAWTIPHNKTQPVMPCHTYLQVAQGSECLQLRCLHVAVLQVQTCQLRERVQHLQSCSMLYSCRQHLCVWRQLIPPSPNAVLPIHLGQIPTRNPAWSRLSGG